MKSCEPCKDKLKDSVSENRGFLPCGMHTRLKADRNNERNVYRFDPSPTMRMLKKLKFFVHFLERTTVTIRGRHRGIVGKTEEEKKKIETGNRGGV